MAEITETGVLPSPTTNGHTSSPYFGPRVNLGKAGTPETKSRSGLGGGVNLWEEYGRTGLRHWGGFVFEEWLRELQQGKRAAEVYREMGDSDPVIGGMLYAIEMLIRRVSWWTEPASSSQTDQKNAEWMDTNWNDMDVSWPDNIAEILSFLQYGWSYHEMVFKRRKGYVAGDATASSMYDDGTIGLAKLPIRAQDSLWKWVFQPNGEIDGLIQNPPPDYLLRYIPMPKALLFRTKVAKGSPEGRSILRSSYKSWYFVKNLQNIEGIGVERDLAGLPILKAPEGVDIWDTNDPTMIAMKNAAQQVVSAIRRDEQEGVILPSGWELTLLSSPGKRQFNTTDIITRYEQRIATSVLLDVILLGQGSVGSYSLATVKKGLFTASLEAYMDQIAEVFNTHCIPVLFAINGFKVDKGFPRLKHGRVEAVDLDTLGNYLQKLAMSGAPLFPNSELLAHILSEAGLPAAEALANNDSLARNDEVSAQEQQGAAAQAMSAAVKKPTSSAQAAGAASVGAAQR